MSTKDMCRRQTHLVCLNIPGMLISSGQPSKTKQAATLVQVGFRTPSLLIQVQGRLWEIVDGR